MTYLLSSAMNPPLTSHLASLDPHIRNETIMFMCAHWMNSSSPAPIFVWTQLRPRQTLQWKSTPAPSFASPETQHWLELVAVKALTTTNRVHFDVINPSVKADPYLIMTENTSAVSVDDSDNLSLSLSDEEDSIAATDQMNSKWTRVDFLARHPSRPIHLIFYTPDPPLT